MTDITSGKSAEEIQNINTFAHKKSIVEYAGMAELFPVEEHILDNYFPSGPAQVLDLGCGGGRTTVHLAERGYQVTAGDIVPEMVEEARKRISGVAFKVLDATCLDLPSEFFDVVWFSFNGLDYIYPFHNRLSALHEIKRVLKPGGIFVYSSHNILGRCTRINRPLISCLLHYHLAFFYHSLRKPLLQNYWRECHYGDNWLNTYCGIPQRQVGTLKNVGFDLLSVESSYGKSIWEITWKDFWPHYVARKPLVERRM